MNNQLINKILKHLIGYEDKDYGDPFCQSLSKFRVSSFGGSTLDIILIDESGSMDEKDYPPSRLAAAKKASIGFLTKLLENNPDAVVGIVSFSFRAWIVHKPVKIRDNFAQLKDAINSLYAKLSTNTGAGLKVCKEIVHRCFNVINPRILCLTDGYNTLGSDPEKIAQKVKKSGIQLDIIGIGGSPDDVNEPKLKRMASVVDGELRYWFIESAGELIRKFEVLALREIK